MAPKVIHISDEVHTEAKDYCARFGLRMKEWAESVLLEAIRNSGGKRPELQSVPKKKAPREIENGGTDGPKPWEQPPFWKRGASEAKGKKSVTGLESSLGEAPVGGGEAPGREQEAHGVAEDSRPEAGEDQGSGVG